MKIILTSILAAVLLSATAFASKPVTLTNDEAVQLYMALDSLKPGLTPDNTGYVALDLNSLRPYAQAHDKALTQLQQTSYALGKSSDPDRDAKLLKAGLDYQKYAQGEITVDLEPVVITKDEMTPAQVSGKTLAVILQFLSPVQPPTKK